MKTYKPDLESTLVWTFCAFKLCFLNNAHKMFTGKDASKFQQPKKKYIEQNSD